MQQACCRPSEAPSPSPGPPLTSSPRTHSALGSGKSTEGWALTEKVSRGPVSTGHRVCAWQGVL